MKPKDERDRIYIGHLARAARRRVVTLVEKLGPKRVVYCAHCGHKGKVPKRRPGRALMYCSDRCKVAAFRARQRF